MSRARSIANFGDGIATADIDDGAITSGKLASGAITSGALPAGSVLQVVQGISTTSSTTTSTSYSDTNLSASITPTSASSKILITVVQAIRHDSNNTTNSGCGIKLLRDSTSIHGGVTRYEQYLQTGNSSVAEIYTKFPLVYLDSPNTTSAITYKTQFATYDSGETSDAQPGSIQSTITLMEIAG